MKLDLITSRDNELLFVPIGAGLGRAERYVSSVRRICIVHADAVVRPGLVDAPCVQSRPFNGGTRRMRSSASCSGSPGVQPLVVPPRG
jgi:hypothetical protein